MAKTLMKPKTEAKAKTGKAASKLNIKETISSSDESFESQSSNRKMASKPTKTKTPKPKHQHQKRNL